jgi:hypothetical protein
LHEYLEEFPISRMFYVMRIDIKCTRNERFWKISGEKQ